MLQRVGVQQFNIHISQVLYLESVYKVVILKYFTQGLCETLTLKILVRLK